MYPKITSVKVYLDGTQEYTQRDMTDAEKAQYDIEQAAETDKPLSIDQRISELETLVLQMGGII